jgi:tRNA(Arg) A34 adenosine deaminase TadA
MNAVAMRGDAATHRHFMGLAIDQARMAMANGEPPFGVVIVDAAGKVVAANYDRVHSLGDLSAHAEVLTVRDACRLRGPDLSGCILYTTCEPCPMCYTTAWLARIDAIVYGTSMAAVHARVGDAQREMRVPVEVINDMGPEPIGLLGGVEAEACLALFC